MIDAPMAWLPPDAHSPERVQPLLERALDEWSEHWFASARAGLSSAFQDDWPDRSGDAGWRSCPGVVSLALTPAAEATIAGTMLGANVPVASLQDDDRSVVHHLARTSVDDLLTRVDRLARGTAGPSIATDSIDSDACSWWEVSIGPRKGILKLALNREAEVQMIKRQLPNPAKIALDSVTLGLAKQQVEIEADLGRCDVSLAELESLAVGDVLVLDTSPADPLTLLVDKERSSLCASLEAREERPFLIVSSGKQTHV